MRTDFYTTSNWSRCSDISLSMNQWYSILSLTAMMSLHDSRVICKTVFHDESPIIIR